MKLKESQIEFIDKDLEDRGITYADLKEDLLDHICCEVEKKMGVGKSFMDAYQEAIAPFKKQGIAELNNETTSILSHFTMIRSYINITFRNIFKHKVFSAINVIGLGIGMAACFIILQYVNYEWSFDRFHNNYSSVYRITQSTSREGGAAFHTATTYLPVAKLARDEYPEIIDYNRLYFLDRHAILTFDEKKFEQPAVLYADANFFNFFNYGLISGDESEVLQKMNTVVLSESVARKYFEGEEPIGKVMQLTEEFNDLTLLVTGVFKDPPANSHLKPAVVVSLSSLENLPAMRQYDWRWPFYMNYIKIAEQADSDELEQKLSGFVAKYFQRNDEQKSELKLQPLSDIHLYSNLEYEIAPNGDAQLMFLLLAVGLLTLLIAYANYINLSTARSLDRAKEVGIRKALGSRKTGLVQQFLTEAIIINLLAVLVAIVMVRLIMYAFLDYAGVEIHYTTNVWFWVASVFLFGLGAILSSIYPSFVLSSFQPISALKGKLSHSLGGQSLRQVLVLGQFVASISLMIAAYAVYDQMNFMRSQPLGVEIDNVLVVNGPRIDNTENMDGIDPFTLKVVEVPSVVNATLSSSVPGIWTGRVQGVSRQGSDEGKETFYSLIATDNRFVDTYQLELMAGRNFSDVAHNDSTVVLINESALKLLGFNSADEAVNTPITIRGRQAVVIGVINDYHHFALRTAIEPQLLFQRSDESKEYYSIKISGQSNDISTTMAAIEAEWESVYPNNPFEYFFLNASFDAQYAADLQFEKVFTAFSLLAVFIACMGLYGLASFVAMKRTKEIGIRKVLGSSVNQIIILLAIGFTRLILIAGLIAIPLAYIGIQSWQSNFAYQTNLDWWVFVLPVLVVTVIAMVTISIETIKVALINPVNILKYD
ncbi:MAG: ABC transporter permease [Cyclobacteriaceae bacterium]